MALMFPKPFGKRRKKKAGVEKSHLALIRQLPCCACGSPHSVHAHHLQDSRLGRGMGLKSHDRFTVPLCEGCHQGEDGIHSVGSKMEPLWFLSKGVLSEKLAGELHDAGDLDAMRVALLDHRGE